MVDRLLLLASNDATCHSLLSLSHHVLLVLALLLYTVDHALVDVMLLGLRVHAL